MQQVMMSVVSNRTVAFEPEKERITIGFEVHCRMIRPEYDFRSMPMHVRCTVAYHKPLGCHEEQLTQITAISHSTRVLRSGLLPLSAALPFLIEEVEGVPSMKERLVNRFRVYRLGRRLRSIIRKSRMRL